MKKALTNLTTNIVITIGIPFALVAIGLMLIADKIRVSGFSGGRRVVQSNK